MQNNLLFSYWWTIKRNLNKQDIKTVLDLGCGKGQLGDSINKNYKFDITGVDIFPPYLTVCKQNRRYKKVFKADLSQKLPFPNRSFDAVVALQVIEHLPDKKAKLFLSECNRITRKIVIITTPMGESIQEEYDNNIYQKHQSTWYPDDFIKLGYKVFGNGLKLIYGNYSLATKENNVLKIPLYLLSFLLNPITYFIPILSCQMIAVKNN